MATDIGIDLGTASILVYVKGKGVVLKEPSVVAIDRDTDKIKAVGEEARLMIGRTPGNIVAVRPLKQGVISDYSVTEQMIRYFIQKAVGKRSYKKPRICVCIPSGATEVETKAVQDAAFQAGAREVFVVEEPLAAAIGAGIEIKKPCGNMIVDIGGGTTDLVEFVDGMPDGKYSISDKAALYCIGKVNEEAIAKTGAGVPAYITEAFMRTGSYDCPKQYQDVIKNCLKSYAEEIYGIIQANHYNLDLTKMVFMGGGSSIVEHFGANEGKDVQFVTDIHANARGCEEAVKSIIRAKQRKMRTA